MNNFGITPETVYEPTNGEQRAADAVMVRNVLAKAYADTAKGFPVVTSGGPPCEGWLNFWGPADKNKPVVA